MKYLKNPLDKDLTYPGFPTIPAGKALELTAQKADELLARWAFLEVVDKKELKKNDTVEVPKPEKKEPEVVENVEEEAVEEKVEKIEKKPKAKKKSKFKK